MLDKKGRPVRESTTSDLELLAAIHEAWHYHPNWHLGQLIQKAANIPVGTRVAVEFAHDESLLAGLKALVPDDWEIELDNQA